MWNVSQAWVIFSSFHSISSWNNLIEKIGFFFSTKTIKGIILFLLGPHLLNPSTHFGLKQKFSKKVYNTSIIFLWTFPNFRFLFYFYFEKQKWQASIWGLAYCNAMKSSENFTIDTFSSGNYANILFDIKIFCLSTLKRFTYPKSVQ